MNALANPRLRVRRTFRQAGFSLVELMISLALGLVVVGAVFAAYLGSTRSSANSRAMAQITEDASIALSVLRSTISATSFLVTNDSNGSGFVNGVDDGQVNTLRGCNNSFSDPDVAITALACDAGDGPHAIAVSYYADAFNSAVSGGGVPLDCLGNEIPVNGTVYKAYQRFFVDTSDNTLRCQGPGSDTDQALVDNVVDMRIRYGVDGGPSGDDKDRNRVVRYLDAEEVRASAEGEPLFDRAVSVRVCVTIASAGNALDAVTPYRDCEGAEQTPADGDLRMFRSFTSTIVLNNRLEAR